MSPIFACAHRGASCDFPENTIPAFAEAVRLGCGMVEFDVRATADGVPVILHDPTVDRTTDGAEHSRGSRDVPTLIVMPGVHRNRDPTSGLRTEHEGSECVAATGSETFS